ncbi:MAG: ATP-binding protein [Patescibacteria group bacterium]|nr:ATP-binding protein [Patescibacteria group bacterium]
MKIPLPTRKLIRKLVEPRSKKEDIRRREFILNVILLSTIILASAALLRIIVDVVRFHHVPGIPARIALIIIGILVFLYRLSKKGKIDWACYILIFMFTAPISYTVFVWGPDLPQAFITYSLIIVMSGILMGTRLAVITTFTISVYCLILSYLQSISIYHPDAYWRNRSADFSDVIVAVITLSIITVISWLYNREIEKSLKRAHQSEAALKKERDLLEIRVIKRTKELQKTQLEKMAQMAHFAEFGWLASGIFHDLVNPLSAVSLNLEQMRQEDSKRIESIKPHLKLALQATKKMESFISAVRKQVQQTEINTYFLINKEVEQAIQILSYKARKANVKLIFNEGERIKIFGNPLKLHQAITNLLTNAIDAYHKSSLGKTVQIKLYKAKNKINLEVCDFGQGIPEKNLEKIFNPFFTTKDLSKGMGIGLAMTKNIIEKDFSGTIAAKSNKEEGTVFKIELPMKKELIKKNGQKLKSSKRKSDKVLSLTAKK